MKWYFSKTRRVLRLDFAEREIPRRCPSTKLNREIISNRKTRFHKYPTLLPWSLGASWESLVSFWQVLVTAVVEIIISSKTLIWIKWNWSWMLIAMIEQFLLCWYFVVLAARERLCEMTCLVHIANLVSLTLLALRPSQKIDNVGIFTNVRSVPMWLTVETSHIRALTIWATVLLEFKTKWFYDNCRNLRALIG